MTGGTHPVQPVPGIPVVTAPDEIDITNADELRGAIESAGSQAPAVVVDMSRTQFCDTAGLHVLVGAHKRARSAGAEVRLVVCTQAVLRILEITGINGVIPQFASLDEALGVPPRDPPAGRDV